MNVELKMKILTKFKCQADFALAVGEHESKVSAVIRNRRKLSPQDAIRWKRTLNCSSDLLKSVTMVG